MMEEELKTIQTLCDSMEEMIQNRIRSVVDHTDPTIVLNVLMNVGTSMVARSIAALSDPVAQEQLTWLSNEMIKAKVTDGTAQMEAFTAINRAKFHSGSPEKKH